MTPRVVTKNVEITTSDTALYTALTDRPARLQSIVIVNKTASTSSDVTINFNRAAIGNDAALTTKLAFEEVVAAKGRLTLARDEFGEHGLRLNSGDSISFLANDNSVYDCTMTVVEDGSRGTQ